MCDTRVAHKILRVRVAAVAVISIFFFLIITIIIFILPPPADASVALSSRPAVLHVNRRNWLNGSRRLDIIAVAYLDGESIFVVKTPQHIGTTS